MVASCTDCHAREAPRPFSVHSLVAMAWADAANEAFIKSKQNITQRRNCIEELPKQVRAVVLLLLLQQNAVLALG